MQILFNLSKFSLKRDCVFQPKIEPGCRHGQNTRCEKAAKPPGDPKRKNIPAFHYMVAVAGGGDIPLVPYATFGTEALSRNVVAGLKERNACLMANHGQIALGPTPAAALELAQEVETLAAQYVRVLSLGEVHVLDAAEMRKVVKRFKSYGQEAQKG